MIATGRVADTANDRDVAVAPKYGEPSPDCDATIVQVPTPTIVAILPETVQTLVVDEAKETANPESAVALSTTDRVANVLSVIAVKVII